LAFDELTLELFIWGNALRAANAVAPNLPPPPEECRPVSKTKPLYQRKYRRCRRGAPLCRHADCRLQWRFLNFRACARPKILERDDIWRIDRLLTQNLYRNGCIVSKIIISTRGSCHRGRPCCRRRTCAQCGHGPSRLAVRRAGSLRQIIEIRTLIR